MTKDPRVYLAHVLECATRIRLYISSGEQAFQRDTMIQDAVIRNLEIIGEAVKNISKDLRAKHSDIPWQQIAGMRDEMIHEYFGVDLSIVWNVVVKDLPTLKRKIDELLES